MDNAGPPTVPGTPSGVSVRPGQIDADMVGVHRRQLVPDHLSGLQGWGLDAGGGCHQWFVDPGDLHGYRPRTFERSYLLGGRGRWSGERECPECYIEFITVATASAAIFSDDFSSGDFANWTSVTRLAIDPGAGSPSAPSARGQVSAQSAFLTKTLPATYAQICVSMNVNAASFGGNSVVLLRLRTASNGPVARVFAGSNGTLFVKSDVSAAQLSSNVMLGVGWHEVELCGTVGSAGAWDCIETALGSRRSPPTPEPCPSDGSRSGTRPPRHGRSTSTTWSSTRWRATESSNSAPRAHVDQSRMIPAFMPPSTSSTDPVQKEDSSLA